MNPSNRLAKLGWALVLAIGASFAALLALNYGDYSSSLFNVSAGLFVIALFVVNVTVKSEATISERRGLVIALLLVFLVNFAGIGNRLLGVNPNSVNATYLYLPIITAAIMLTVRAVRTRKHQRKANP